MQKSESHSQPDSPSKSQSDLQPNSKRESDEFKKQKQGYRLQQVVDKEARRIKNAEKHKHSLLIYSSYAGSLGMVLVLPIVGGAYLGRWLDSFDTGFSISWTVSLIFVGVVIGAINAYYLIKGKF